MLQLTVTEVTTEHRKIPKITNSIKSSFLAPIKASVKRQSFPQELEVSPRSRMYLLVKLKRDPKLL